MTIPLRRRLLGTLALATLLTLLAARPGTAQIFGYDQDRPRIVQSLNAGYARVDFTHTGSDTTASRFEYDGPALVLAYTRPNLEMSLVYGRENGGDLELVDAAIASWGVIGLSDRLGIDRTRLGIPILLLFQLRRASRSDLPEAVTEIFEITAIGLGTGLVLTHPFRDDVVLEARATPTYALALRSLQEAAGTTALVEAEARLHVGPLVRGLGLTFGYDFRWQRWDVDVSDRFTDVPADFFDYTGRQHAITVGINW